MKVAALIVVCLAVLVGGQDHAPPPDSFGPPVAGGPPANRVQITVGEKTGNFIYTVRGITYVPEKITVNGQYFNNDFTRSGYVRLFLTVESGVDYWDTRIPAPNTLDVYVENFNYQRFYFQVTTPYPAHAGDLTYRQINATTVLVEGLPKSAYY